MNFESGGIYHIYNQGNNRQPIFYNRDNYIYFVEKIRNYVIPYGNILAWCLMPNHFHLMVEVESISIDPRPGNGVTLTQPVTKLRTLNDSIGIMLRSYTRAINIQENRSGNLFREETKAICLNEIQGISSTWYTRYGVAFLKREIKEYQYLQVCFNYIHNNPVKSGLTKRPEDWDFSSYNELKGLRNGSLVNRNRVAELGLTL